MGRRPGIPSYRLHKTGQGTCRFPAPFKGKRDYYFGLFDLPESREAYDREIAEWLLAKRNPSIEAPAKTGGTRIATCCDLYLAFAEKKYQKAGRPTGQLACVRSAVNALAAVYGSLLAADFTAKNLKALRAWMATEAPCLRCDGSGKRREKTCRRCGGAGRRGWSRNFINKSCGIVKTMFSHLAEEEIVPASTAHLLRTVHGLRRNAVGVRESKRVLPVSWEVIAKTLPELTSVQRAMVVVQYLAGMRPCEVIGLRRGDINFAGQVDGVGRFPGLWVYDVPDDVNKNAGRDKRRVVFFGRQAMQVLKPFIKRKRPDEFLFSPRESMEEYLKSVGRQINHGKSRIPGDRYTTSSYDDAIERACKRSGVTHWTPNQLRHAKATEIRAKFGGEATRTVLGHAGLDLVEVYAERDFSRAAEIMRKIG